MNRDTPHPMNWNHPLTHRASSPSTLVLTTLSRFVKKPPFQALDPLFRRQGNKAEELRGAPATFHRIQAWLAYTTRKEHVRENRNITAGFPWSTWDCEVIIPWIYHSGGIETLCIMVRYVPTEQIFAIADRDSIHFGRNLCLKFLRIHRCLILFLAFTIKWKYQVNIENSAGPVSPRL